MVVPWFTSLVSTGLGNLFEDFRGYYVGTPEKARSTAAQLVSAMESR
jgi:hypothetical protein